MISKEELYDLYINQKLSIKDFSDRYKIPSATLYRWLKKYNIIPHKYIDIDKETLYRLYVLEGLSAEAIGKKYNVNRKRIMKLCHQFGIEKSYTANRDRAILNAKSNGLKPILYVNNNDILKMFDKCSSYVEIAKQFCVTPSYIKKVCLKYGKWYPQHWDEKYNTLNNQKNIEYLYTEELLSAREISKKLNIPRQFISKYIKEHNIKRKSISTIIKITYEELYDLYVNQKLSTISIGKQFNVHESVINTLIHKYNIPINTSFSQSNNEIELEEYIKNKGIKYQLNCRDILPNHQEIDIYLPNNKLGIEFNGTYWHNESNKGKLYHQNKSINGISQGIFIYHIFEYLWYCKKEQILNKIDEYLNLNTKIDGNDCQIKSLTKSIAQDFINKNDIIDNYEFNKAYGLYYNNELYMIVTFMNNEIKSYCHKIGYYVNNGLKLICDYYIQKYQYNKLIVYNNMAYYKDDDYLNMGFIYKETLEPSFIWCKNKKFIYSSEDLSINGYYKVYDSGYKLLELNK